VTQRVVLGLESRRLLHQSTAQIGILLADLLLLNRLDDGCEQLAIRNAVSMIFVVLPFDQREAVLGF
jgi:hypothetical protein